MSTPSAVSPARPGRPRTRRSSGWPASRSTSLVVGGGITGAGVALDAATRGLSVALVEKRDFAAGTSSRSSKLIHGGLRYLEQLDFGLVREALRERGLLLDVARARTWSSRCRSCYPLRHRAGSAPTSAPASASTTRSRGPSDAAVPRHRHLSRTRGARGSRPSLRPDSLVGAIRYYDAQVDDARFVVAAGAHRRSPTARTSRSPASGSTASLARGRAGRRRRASTTSSRGRELERARPAWSSTRPASGPTRSSSWRGSRRRSRCAPPRASTSLVPRDRIRSETALILRTERSVLFVIPWGAHWIIGTTDTDWDLDRAHPAASRTDIDYLLDHVNARARASRSSDDDVVGVYAGLRPLARRQEAEHDAQLSREHVVRAPVPGPGHDRRRQVHDLPGDGRATRSTPPAHSARRAGARQPSPTRCRCSAPTGYQTPRNQRERARRAAAASASARSTTCSAATAPSPTSCSTPPPSVPTWPSRSPGADDYLLAEVVLRGHARGRAAPRRRADPAHPDLDRDLRPRPSPRPGRSPG